MAMIYDVREMAKGGKGIGRYRMVGLSDEERGVADECCDCDGGHETKDEARACPKAQEKLKRIFPPSTKPTRRESVWLVYKHSQVDGVSLDTVIAVCSTKEKAQDRLAKQAEPSPLVAFSIEEEEVDPND